MSLNPGRYRPAIDTALDAWIDDVPEDIRTQLWTIVSTYDDRLRGNLMLATYDAVSPPSADAEDIMSGAVAVELLHAYMVARRWFLSSDDVSERSGSTPRWDTKTTLRTGNYALLHAVLEVSSLTEDERRPDCLRTMSTTLKSLWKTLSTEQELTATKAVSDEALLRLLENGPLLQTAMAAELGATLGGADGESRENWHEFGREFGKAVILCEITGDSPLSETTQLGTNGSARSSPTTTNERETQKSEHYCTPQVTVRSPYEISALTVSVRRQQQRESIRRAREMLAELPASSIRDDLDSVLVQLSSDPDHSSPMAR